MEVISTYVICYHHHANYFIYRFKDKIDGRLYVYMPFRRKYREYWVYGLKKKHDKLTKKFNSQL